MTSSTRRQTEAVFSNHFVAPKRPEYQHVFKKETVKLDIEKHSVVSLKSYAKQRFQDAIHERDAQHRICMMHYWDGYINAITEILGMEGQ